jgi:hypothetical protein
LKCVAKSAEPRELRAELENVGSNLTVRDRKLHWFPRGAWKLVVDQGSFAQHNAAPEISGAAFVGETRLHPTQCSGEDEIRTRESLLAALIDFFKDNPAWE